MMRVRGFPILCGPLHGVVRYTRDRMNDAYQLEPGLDGEFRWVHHGD